MNLGPHPYQQNAGNRCAKRRSRRSRPTVEVEVMCSRGVQLCALSQGDLRTADAHRQPHTSCLSDLPTTCTSARPYAISAAEPISMLIGNHKRPWRGRQQRSTPSGDHQAGWPSLPGRVHADNHPRGERSVARTLLVAARLATRRTAIVSAHGSCRRRRRCANQAERPGQGRGRDCKGSRPLSRTGTAANRDGQAYPRSSFQTAR